MLAYGSHNNAEETDSQRGYDAAEDAEGVTPLAGEQGKNHKHALDDDEENAQEEKRIEKIFEVGNDRYYGEEEACDSSCRQQKPPSYHSCKTASSFWGFLFHIDSFKGLVVLRG